MVMIKSRNGEWRDTETMRVLHDPQEIAPVVNKKQARRAARLVENVQLTAGSVMCAYGITLLFLSIYGNVNNAVVLATNSSLPLIFGATVLLTR